MKNIQPKNTRHKNTPIKQLISIIMDRYAKATVAERKSILNFFDWVIRNTAKPDLKNFHIEVKTRLEQSGAGFAQIEKGEANND